jgi:hypothetical protein
MKHKIISVLIAVSIFIISRSSYSEEFSFAAKITSGPCQSRNSQMKGSGTLFNYNGEVYFLTSEHVVYHTKKNNFCHVVSNSTIGDVKSELLFADWGSGLALLKLHIETSPKFLNYPADFKKVNSNEVIVVGSPFDQSNIISDHGIIINEKGERLLSPIIKKSLEIDGAHGEFGMSGGPVLQHSDQGYVFRGLLSHQVLVMKPGSPTRADEWDADDKFQNQLLSIDVSDVAIHLQNYFTNKVNFKVSFYRDILGQMNDSGAIIGHGLIFKPEIVNNQIVPKSFLGRMTVRKAGGVDPIGIGGVGPTDLFYVALNVEVFNGAEEFSTVISKDFPLSYSDSLTRIKKILYANQLVKIPSLVFQDTEESLSLTAIKVRSISELFSLITDERYSLVVKNLSENNQLKIQTMGEMNLSLLQKIKIDDLLIENRSIYLALFTISNLAKENNLDLVKCDLLQLLSSRSERIDRFWSDMLQKDFDVSTKLLQSVKYFAKACN